MRHIPEAILDVIETMHLPAMPQVLLRFLSVAEDENAEISHLAALVAQDPALSARILTIANSAAIKSRCEIRTIEQCLITLGTCLVRVLATCLAIQSAFSRDGSGQCHDYSGFWNHSLRVAELARTLALNLNYPKPDEAYLAGLLHDTGQLLLLGGANERYAALLACSVDETALYGLEKSLFDTDHAEVGAWLVDQWQIPSFMADAILFHHRPVAEIVGADLLSRIVWSAHCACSDCEKITDSVEKADYLSPSIESVLGAGTTLTGSQVQEAFQRVSMLAEALAIGENDTMRSFPRAAAVDGSDEAPADEQSASLCRIEAMVRNMTLLQSLQQNLSAFSMENEILAAVRECARILFGLRRIAFLLADNGALTLSGPDIAGQSPLLCNIRISLEERHSLAAVAVAANQPRATFDSNEKVLLTDVQVARTLGSKGVLYVPMRDREQRVGVMAFGVSDGQWPAVRPLLGWMSGFAAQAAANIAALRTVKNREQHLENNLISHFEQQTRKVVHEAANPLSIIKNYLKILSQRYAADSGLQPELEILREEIDRVVHIVQRLNGISASAPTSDKFDANAVIDGMLSLYGESLFTDRGIAIEKMLSPSMKAVHGDRDNFKQILFNIWKNASEAMTSGGRFTIATHEHLIQDDCVYSAVSMSDSGPGLPDDVLTRLFQPLDANRRPGHSGIGLSIVAELVERMGGRISCQSSPGHGASFTILLQKHNAGEK